MNGHELEEKRKRVSDYQVCRLRYDPARKRYSSSSRESGISSFWSVLFYTLEIHNAVAEGDEQSAFGVDERVEVVNDDVGRRVRIMTVPHNRWRSLGKLDQIMQQRGTHCLKLNFPGARNDGNSSINFQGGEHVYAFSEIRNYMAMSVVNAV